MNDLTEEQKEIIDNYFKWDGLNATMFLIIPLPIVLEIQANFFKFIVDNYELIPKNKVTQ